MRKWSFSDSVVTCIITINENFKKSLKANIAIIAYSNDGTKEKRREEAEAS